MPDQDLISVRGLIDSEFEEQLRKFTGTFAEYETMPAQGYSGTRIDLRFGDVDDVTAMPGVIFALPTKVINIGLGNKNKSRWGYFANSLADVIPSDEDIKHQKGKRMTLVFCDGQDGRPEPKPIWNKSAGDSWKAADVLVSNIAALADVTGKTEELDAMQKELEELGELFQDGMVPTPVWIVTELEGVAAPAKPTTGKAAAPVKVAATGVSASDLAEEQLVGKTRAEFNKWAFADPVVRKDTALQRSISDKSFINGLIQLGRIEEDENGVFQVPA